MLLAWSDEGAAQKSYDELTLLRIACYFLYLTEESISAASLSGFSGNVMYSPEAHQTLYGELIDEYFRHTTKQAPDTDWIVCKLSPDNDTAFTEEEQLVLEALIAKHHAMSGNAAKDDVFFTDMAATLADRLQNSNDILRRAKLALFRETVGLLCEEGKDQILVTLPKAIIEADFDVCITLSELQNYSDHVLDRVAPSLARELVYTMNEPEGLGAKLAENTGHTTFDLKENLHDILRLNEAQTYFLNFIQPNLSHFIDGYVSPKLLSDGAARQ